MPRADNINIDVPGGNLSVNNSKVYPVNQVQSYGSKRLTSTGIMCAFISVP